MENVKSSVPLPMHDHHHDHAHPQDHAHTHDHDHSHGGAGEYYLEQLLTIFICCAFGMTAILMYQWQRLKVILQPEFHFFVLLGGISLVAIGAFRGLALWLKVPPKEHDHDQGETEPSIEHAHVHDHAHAHAPGEKCDHPKHKHDHAHVHDETCGHDHKHESKKASCCDHGHEPHSHGGVFWRIVVLAFPILLFAMGLPSEGFSNEWKMKRVGDVKLGAFGSVAAKGGDTLVMPFDELNSASANPGKRQQYEGQKVQVHGQLKQVQGAEKDFTLFKSKMNCCAADVVMLKAFIRTEYVPSIPNMEWVTAEGVLQFVEMPGRPDEYVPVIRVKDGGLQKAAPGY